MTSVPDTGIFRGVDQVVDRLRGITDAPGHTQFEVRSLEDCREHVLAAVVMHAERSSGTAAAVVAQFHLSRWAEGRVREFR